MANNKIISFLILFFISLIPFFLVMYIWYSAPDNMELGGLIYIFGIPLLFPVTVAFVVITYKLVSQWLKLAKLSIIFIIVVPVVINLISTQWYFIQVAIARASYFNQYKGLNLEIKLVEDNLVPATNEVYNFAADYQYKLLLNNPSDKSFKNVDIWVSLNYKTSEGKELDLGLNNLKLNIKPGENILEETILIDSSALRCGYSKAQSPLQLVVKQNILEREKSISIPLELGMKDALLEINNNLELANRGANFPLRDCLQN